MTETSAEKIVQEQGKVTAVKANRKGEEITLETKAVILADGGFVGNKDEIKRTLAIDPDDLYSMGERKATGDGLQMLKEAGGVSDYKRIFEKRSTSGCDPDAKCRYKGDDVAGNSRRKTRYICKIFIPGYDCRKSG